MEKLMIYIHGKGGSADEAEHYKPLFGDCDVIGFDYRSEKPWEAENEFPAYFDEVSIGYKEVVITANSIGAYFAMIGLKNKKIERAYFVSPIVNMERLIESMIQWAGITEEELKKREEYESDFGETLSWKYLLWVREHPVNWNVRTDILYSENDNLQSAEVIDEFAGRTEASVTVMKSGEHWFHTDEQMQFLDRWLKDKIMKNSLGIIIETGRLYLREMNSDDFDALYRVLADADIMKHYPYTFDDKRVRRWIDRNIERYEIFGFGLWAVCLKETGEMIGDCGLTMQKINGTIRPEIGYHIRKDMQRKGYAKEAASAVRSWTFDNTPFGQVFSYMKKDNYPSVRTAESIGMIFIGEYTDENNGITCVYGIKK